MDSSEIITAASANRGLDLLIDSFTPGYVKRLMKSISHEGIVVDAREDFDSLEYHVNLYLNDFIFGGRYRANFVLTRQEILDAPYCELLLEIRRRVQAVADVLYRIAWE